MDTLTEYIRQVGVRPFAKKMGVSPGYVYHILAGRRNPSRKFAEKCEEISGGYLKKQDILWGGEL